MKYKVLKDYIDENGQMTRVGDTWGSPCKTKFEDGEITCYVYKNGYAGGISCLVLENK